MNMEQELLKELEEKSNQVLQLTQDFEEYQETSKAFEQELEQEIENQSTQIKTLQDENSSLKDEIKKLKEDYRKKMNELEINNEKLMKELKLTVEKLKYAQRMKKELEIDMDIINSKLREKDYENNQLTEYYHSALEDLAITCSELDNLKDHNAETTQRLKDQLRELNNELEMIHQNKGRRTGRAHTVTDIFMQEPKLKNSLIGKNSTDMLDTLLESLSNRLRAYQA